MSARIFIPLDSAAVALGADDVAAAMAREALARGVALTVTRTGSHGMHWLEPLVEVETPAGRTAYGPVTAADVTTNACRSV